MRSIRCAEIIKRQGCRDCQIASLAASAVSAVSAKDAKNLSWRSWRGRPATRAAKCRPHRPRNGMVSSAESLRTLGFPNLRTLHAICQQKHIRVQKACGMRNAEATGSKVAPRTSFRTSKAVRSAPGRNRTWSATSWNLSMPSRERISGASNSVSHSAHRAFRCRVSSSAFLNPASINFSYPGCNARTV